MKFRRRSSSATLAVAIVALVGACTSNPSAKAVAEDYVESIDGLTDEQRQCMLQNLDEYSNETLESIGDANLNVNFDEQDAVDQASPAFQEFVADLRQGCFEQSG